MFLTPSVVLLSWLIDPLALSFRPVEMAALGGATAFTAAVVWEGESSRTRGVLLLAGYAVAVVAFYVAGASPQARRDDLGRALDVGVGRRRDA